MDEATTLETASEENQIEPWQFVREVFNSFEVVLKVRRLYDQGNHLRRDAELKLIEKFVDVFTELPEFTVDISADAIEFEGRTLLKAPRTDSSVPFRLFQDGVRSLNFVRGITADELRTFLDIVEFDPDESGNDDIVSKLWREDFRFIQYEATEEIEISGDTAFNESEIEKEIADLIEELTDYVPDRFSAQDREVSASAKRQEVYELERRQDGKFEDKEATLVLSEETLIRIRREVENDKLPTLVARTVVILFKLLEHPHADLGRERIEELIAQLAQLTLSRGQFPLMNHLLGRLDEDSELGAKSRRQEIKARIFKFLSDEKWPTLIRDTLLLSYEGTPRDIGQFFRTLPNPTLEHYWILPVEVRELPIRAELLSVFFERSKKIPRAFSRLIRKLDPKVLKEVLGEALKNDPDPDLIRSLLDSEESSVRAEAVGFVEALGIQERLRILSQFLRDPIPEVRFAALRKIEQLGETRMQGALIQLLQTGSFESEDRVRMVHAVAVLGGLSAVECLRTHTKPVSRLFGLGKKNDDERYQILVALHDIEDNAVRAFLASCTKSGDKVVAKASRVAMSRSQLRMKSTRREGRS